MWPQSLRCYPFCFFGSLWKICYYPHIRISLWLKKKTGKHMTHSGQWGWRRQPWSLTFAPSANSPLVHNGDLESMKPSSGTTAEPNQSKMCIICYTAHVSWMPDGTGKYHYRQFCHCSVLLIDKDQAQFLRDPAKAIFISSGMTLSLPLFLISSFRDWFRLWDPDTTLSLWDFSSSLEER